MLGLLFNLHLSLIKSLLLSLKKFIKRLLSLLLSPVLLLLELIQCLFSQCSVLFCRQESWRHLSSLLYLFTLSMLIIFLLLFLELCSLLSLSGNDLVSGIAFKGESFSFVESLSLLFRILLSLLGWLMQLGSKRIIIKLLFFKVSLLGFLSDCLNFSIFLIKSLVD